MKSLISAGFFVSAAGITSLAAGLVSSIAIARILGAEGTGLTALALWVALTAFAVANLGIPSTILRYISRIGKDESETRGFLRTLYGPYVVSLTLFTGAFFLYASWEFYEVNLNTAFVWFFAGLIFLAYSHGLLVIVSDHGLGHFHRTAWKTAAGCALQIPVTIAGALLFGPAGAMFGYLARHLPQMFGLSKYLRGGASEPVAISDQMRRYSRSIWASELLDQLVKTRIEFIFIGWFFSITELGFFAAGITFSSLILQLSVYLAAGLTPGFGKLYDDDAMDQLRLSYDRTLRWLTMLLLPISLGGAAIMSELIPLAFGQDFTATVPIAEILVLFSLPQALSSVPLAAMLALENDRKLLFINGVTVLVLVALNLTLTPIFGGIGAAWIRGVVGLSSFLWLIHHCRHALGFRISLAPYLRILVSGLACAGAAFVILREVHGVPGLAIAIPAGALAYLIALRLTKAIPGAEIEIMRDLLGKVTPAHLRKHALRLVSILG
ncbi:lipopolysaccharide biosynthesis protein [Roseibium aggregatum]|uniref:Polysaccharide biosynthesis protein n=1 Tax=Roseibium aggregatum TaxID=187304 RepID=A0A939EBB0_9HYPH|nr:oligosaccharide flippase family protein [Roseibium aggregatum]MBN9668755.1 polysaccharide biosynthesis protein [Roseibium aggregatum]